MQRFLAATAFSFFVISALLFWRGYQASQGLLGEVAKGRVVLFYVGAGFSAILGIAGTKARHQRLRDRDDR